jgi:hypothetical protein
MKTLSVINEIKIVQLSNNLVPIKPICQALGIDESTQRKKLNEDDFFNPVTVLSTATGADKKEIMYNQKQESKAVEHIYQDTEIHFLLGIEKNVMVNATEMAKAFGKRIDFFLKSDHAKEFIKVLELTPYGGSSTLLKPEEIKMTKNGVGTYFHRILALKFAAWLDPKFELWVYSTIENILFGKAKEAGNKISEVALQEEKIKNLRTKLMDSGSEDAKNLLKEESLLVEMKKNKNKAVSIFVKSNQVSMEDTPEFNKK